MEKRLKKLLLFYITAFLLLVFAGCVSMQLVNGEEFTGNFLLSLSAIALRGGNFENLLSTNTLAHFIVLALMHFGALLWLFFCLHFANIIGQAKIFHNFEEGDNYTLTAKAVVGKALIYILLLEVFFGIILYAFGQKFASGNIPLWALFNGVSIATQSGFNYQLYTQLFSEAYIFHFVIACLLIVSRLGYPVFFDLGNIYRLRQRMLYPGKNWTLQTRISIYFTAVLLIVGSVIFWIANSEMLKEMKLVSAGISVFFNVSAWAGAGLYTFLPHGLLLSLLAAALMLAGTAPGSFGLLTYGLYANLFSNRPLRRVAGIVLAYCIFIVSVSTLILRLNTTIGFSKSLFYSISVFTSSGLYKQAFLSPVIYAFLLFAGRIGVPMVLVFAYLKFCKNERPSELMLI